MFFTLRLNLYLDFRKKTFNNTCFYLYYRTYYHLLGMYMLFMFHSASVPVYLKKQKSVYLCVLNAWVSVYVLFFMFVVSITIWTLALPLYISISKRVMDYPGPVCSSDPGH